MLEKVENLTDINGFTYRNLVDANMMYSAQHGFKYLNSADYGKTMDEIDSVTEAGVQKINNDKHWQTFKLWKEINERRESHMLQNIYAYSRTNHYEQAVFTIGAAHRKSIIEKILKRPTDEVKLSWSF